MQYLGFTAFWYFIVSFTFESRLFILVWRAQLEERQLFDTQYLRRQLTWFYIMFYVACFVAVCYQSVLLYETWAIFVFCASLWVPQIVHSYFLKSRKGPTVKLAIALSCMQTFLPMYLKFTSGGDNFLDQP